MDAYDIAVLAVLYGYYIRGDPRVLFMKVNANDSKWYATEFVIISHESL
jgi:hypothetical protein